MVEHIIQQHNVHPADTESLHANIRIPGPETAWLKLFRCLNCPGEGTRFAALTEDCLLNHVTDKHGASLAERHAKRLMRECRACQKSFPTDAELTDHVGLSHLHKGSVVIFPFAGVGPHQSETSRSPSNEYLALRETSKKRSARGGFHLCNSSALVV